MTSLPPQRLVVFGTTGDLMWRYLAPSLAHLERRGVLGDLDIVGAAPAEWSTSELRARLADGIARFAPGVADADRARLLDRTEYVQADVTHPASVEAVVSGDRPVIAYLALPPEMFAPAIEGLGGTSLSDDSRVVIEKPFGVDLESARGLNEIAHRHFAERSVFRVDHFLGIQTVQNLIGLRFANRMIEPLLDGRHVGHVEIVWDESLTLEGRAGYYDHAGALRDMVQNHLLQVLCLLTMEAPVTFTADDVRDRKVDLLRTVRHLTPDEAAARSVRGRYGPGRIDGRAVPAYVDEPGVDPSRGTETFAQVTLELDSWRWQGTPVTLRSGKALGGDRREILVHFRDVPHRELCGDVPANLLRLRLEPDRLEMQLAVNAAGEPLEMEPLVVSHDFPGGDVPAYVWVLDAVLRHDPTLSIRADEAEEAWRILAPFLEAWDTGRVPLHTYPAGAAASSVAGTYGSRGGGLSAT